VSGDNSRAVVTAAEKAEWWVICDYKVFTQEALSLPLANAMNEFDR